MSIITETAKAANAGTKRGLREVLDFLVTEEQLGVTLLTAAIGRAAGGLVVGRPVKRATRCGATPSHASWSRPPLLDSRSNWELCLLLLNRRSALPRRAWWSRAARSRQDCRSRACRKSLSRSLS